MHSPPIATALALLMLVACTAPSTAPDERGPHPVGSRTLFLDDGTRGRRLPVEVWYPAVEDARTAAEAGESILAMIPDEGDRAAYESLLDDAPEACVTRGVTSARDAEPAGSDRFPLVVLSHCLNCTRFGYTHIAEHLASRGIAVAAVDHVGNTFFDELADASTGLNAKALAERVGDVRFLLDRLLDANASDVPVDLRGRFDSSRVGAMGHSFGSITTGAVAMEDSRVKAIAGLAAPLESPLFSSVVLPDAVPLLVVVAQEDNSIGEIGNDMIRANFDEARAAAWKVELKDAGHFSFTTFVGLHPSFAAGCGEATRQTDPEATFTYAPVDDVVVRVQTWLAAFFAAQLQDDETARAFLDAPPAMDEVDVDHR